MILSKETCSILPQLYSVPPQETKLIHVYYNRDQIIIRLRFTSNTNNSEKTKQNKNKETKTKKKNNYKLKQKHLSHRKKNCFNLEKFHCRKTHCSFGLGTEKWKKKNKSQRIERFLFLFALVRSRQNSMADVSQSMGKQLQSRFQISPLQNLCNLCSKQSTFDILKF